MEPTHFESLYPDNAREKEVEKILEWVKQGNSCQVVSLPGAGRSNLLGLLSYNRNVRIKHLGDNQKWFHFVLLNFAEMRKRPLLDVTKFIFLSLVDSLRVRKKEEEFALANTIFKESLSLNDELVLFQGLKRTIDLLAIEKELTIVFLFDRFEDYLPMLVPEFFGNLRVLRDRAKYRFSVVFSLTRPLEDVIEPSLFADFHDFLSGHVTYLQFYDKPCLDFRIGFLEKTVGKKIEPNLLKEIVRLTKGHGKLTRLCAESVLSEDPKAKKLEELFLTHPLIKSALSEIWNSLTPSEQACLENNAKCETDNSFLENSGLVRNNQLQIPLFEHYVKKMQQQLRTTTDHITLDETTNDLFKGKTVLTDKLTSSEFKLLKFLFLNKERVIEREEIVNAVWADAKSTAGVSEQALDQLIFRVRRKIEDDPNNSSHLQTVKGRGFRFIP